MVALAYSSGHYKHKLEAKSLLNGQEGMQTVILKSTMTRGRLANGSAYSILKKYWDPRTVEHVRNMKTLRNGTGVVFDLRADQFDAFIENFERVQETQSRIDFDVQKCSELPDLDEDGPGTQNWRDSGSRPDTAPIKKSYHNGDSYQSNWRGGRGGNRGGYGGGYQKNNYGGGGDYQRNNYGGGYGGGN